ncbi:hypothetical protein P3L10_019354 [Capsicum annuum]
MGRSCNLLFALAVFILLHHHISLAIVPNISTNEAALLALKSHISSHRNNILARNCNNSFYGELPVKLAHLQRLKLISVTSNNFTGNIPSFLSLLPNLRFVYLSSNQFSGEIPSSLSNLTKLKELRIQNNFLKGEIPRGISDLHYLTILDLQLNELTGSIPTSIFNITMMQNIALTENNLTGQLPITICNHLPNLKGLHLSKNYLSGVIPPNIEKCRKLQILSLSLKEFIGTVPRELSNLTALTGLYISDLHLEVPSIFRKQAFSSISNSSKLRRIDLSINSFTGLIPESLGNLRYLEHLNLAGNTFFSDTTFSSLTPLTNCRNLRVLSFDGNQLDSTFPTSVGNFSNSSQTFTAPDFDWTYSKYYPRHAEPSRTLPKKQQDRVSHTRFYMQFKESGALDLSGNQFSGSVPPCIGNVTSLRNLYLDYNRLDSRLPASIGGLHDLIEFNISSNLLSGTIRQEIGNLKAVTLVDLSKNNFSGKIPSILGDLDKLINLSMAHNRLDGPIPYSFGKLVALEFLDLCYNNLGGEIPKLLEALVYLKYLNFSFNNLKGEIPIGGPFANVTSQSFLSNDALCVLIGLYTLLGTGSFLTLAVGYMVLRLRKRKKNAGQADVSLANGHERISYYELEQATEGFNESNLLGKGSFSIVYKGILKDGTFFAAKVFNVQQEGAFKSFDTECEILRNLRHRNLTKIITSCSNLDFKALVLEYMPNGTLYRWLYSHNLFLNLLQRLDIMIDVASAMNYLHNGYSTPVVHCDLDPPSSLIPK